MKRRFKKVYPYLVLLPCNFPGYIRVAAKYGEYNDKSNVEGSEIPYGVKI